MRPHRLERWFLANRASVLAAVRRAHGAEAGNRTQVGRLPSDCSATELQRLEPIPGLEPGYRGYEPRASPPMLDRLEPSVRIELTSPVYRTGASPAMLTRLETLVRGTGLEPVSMPWQGNILAARRTQHWSEIRESNPSVLFGRQMPNGARPIPLILKTTISIVKEHGRGPRTRTGNLLLPTQGG